MISQAEFNHWCQQHHLSAEARAMIDHIRSSPPARRMRSASQNVSGQYPSRKMGRTIQFESHRNELAAIYELEHDPTALEYYDQPTSIKLEYEAKNGRRIAVFHTPDYFVLRLEP